jgi:glycosyltransferase involved in cell wall biosynthesis
MKIILIGNYLPDKQESMKLFAKMLERGFQSAGYETELWLPKVFFGRFSSNTYGGIGKWLAYLDKWLLYPLYLRLRLMAGSYNMSNARFHICDHSNSPYLAHLPKDITAITCHDVLAIRGALGFKDAYCEASRLGVILQKWILSNLCKAKRLACVSMFTMRQLNELDAGNKNMQQKDWRVIVNAFNQDFYPANTDMSHPRLRALGVSPEIPYILHVGSSLPRKNRKLLVGMLAVLREQWNGMVCFTGQAIDDELKKEIMHYGLQDRVISVVNPAHDDLVALYSACEAFVFPSYSEGFGWPVIEAQACGAPVLTSNIEPMPEVSGMAAKLENPDNAKDFADAFLSLQNREIRSDLIKKGFENCARFAPSLMTDAYLQLHRLERK